MDEAGSPDQIKVILSDLHLGTGNIPGYVNPYEDFRQDERLVELIDYYERREASVEIILDGDFLDLLKVCIRGEFPSEVTEDVSVEKVRRCIRGHPMVFDRLAQFLERGEASITYIAGNHDMDIAFPRVQRLIRARLGVDEGDSRLKFVPEGWFYRLPRGVVVTHGHMFEAVNRVEGGSPVVELEDGRKILNLPWGSRFYTRVLAPFKGEQPLLDLVQPLSSFILWGLVFDLRFTLRVLWRMARFVLGTRVIGTRDQDVDIIGALQVVAEELALFTDIQRRAANVLRSADDMTALIAGHTHQPMVRRYPGNKLYINTGTWIPRVSLDLRNLGTLTRLTYCDVVYPRVGPPSVKLKRWRGRLRECEEVVA